MQVNQLKLSPEKKELVMVDKSLNLGGTRTPGVQPPFVTEFHSIGVLPDLLLHLYL